MRPAEKPTQHNALFTFLLLLSNMSNVATESSDATTQQMAAHLFTGTHTTKYIPSYNTSIHNTAFWLTACPTFIGQIGTKSRQPCPMHRCEQYRPSRQGTARTLPKTNHEPEQHLQLSAHSVIVPPHNNDNNNNNQVWCYYIKTTTTKCGATTLQPISQVPTRLLRSNRPCHICRAYSSHEPALFPPP